MLRALLVGIALIWGCGTTENPASEPSSETANEAGKVIEVTGKVTATRGGTARALAVGNPVSADDVIDTADTGSVVIELFHNNARWSLESGIKSRVDESVAWGLPKQEAAKVVDHATSAAGRHADRQAAETSVSAAPIKPESATAAVEAPASPPSPAPGAGIGEGKAVGGKTATAPRTTKTKTYGFEGDTIDGELRRPESAPKPADKPRSDPSSSGGKSPPKDSPASSGGCDEVSCVISNYQGACCSRFKNKSNTDRLNKTGGSGPAGASDLPEVVSKEDIQKAMAAVKARLAGCGTQANVTGKVTITIKVGSNGRVTEATIKESPNPAVDGCVVREIKNVKFPASKSGTTFTYPFTL